MAKSSKLIAAKRGTVLLVRRKEDQLWKEVKNRNRGYADRRHLIAFDSLLEACPRPQPRRELQSALAQGARNGDGRCSRRPLPTTDFCRRQANRTTIFP